MPAVEHLKKRVEEMLIILGGSVSGRGRAKAPKVDLSIPEREVQRLTSQVDQILEVLKHYVTQWPTKQDFTEAMRHPLASQIVIFTTRDKKHKSFFARAYFETKFESLPQGQKEFLSATGKKTAFREALILSQWWISRNKGFNAVVALWHEIQNDYNSSPEVRREMDAKAHLEDLMGIPDVEETARLLTTLYPSDIELKEFAKIVSLRIPPQPRGKTALKLTLHERLARQVHSLGGVARLQLD